LRKILKRGTHRTAESTRGAIAQVFHHAILDGRAKHNPARELVGFVEHRPARHHAHLEGKDLPTLFQAIDNYGGRVQTKLALKLLALTFVRVRELVEATWDEFDLERATWTIPAHRMKARKLHVVPLSDQALELLRQAKAAATKSRFVFPSLSRLDRPISATTLNFALDEMGFAGRLTPHGLRATASTVLNGMGFSPDLIEKQLAHMERNPVRAAYNHSDLLPERRAMMQRWSDYIDGLCAGADVTPIRRAA
jgi:integrase